MKYYRIRDLQFAERYFGGDKGIIFKNKKEILEQLISYHEIDYKGVKDDDNYYQNLREFLDEKYIDDEEKLNFILDYGEWGIEEVKK